MISTATTILSEEKKAKECYSMKLDLLMNSTVVNDAIRFVSPKSKQKIESSSDNKNGKDEEVSNEYHIDDQQIEQEHDELGSASTVNRVFQAMVS